MWAAPVGEYLFFGLQTVLVGLWLCRVGFDPSPFEGDLGRGPRAAGALAWLAALGVWFLVAGAERFLYLGAVLAWACPVLALQWGVGGAVLVRRPRPWLVGVAVPTLYLCAVDRVAIGAGVWTVAADTATGAAVVGLPVEEAVFFALTSALVVQGLVLFEWAALRWGHDGTGTRDDSRNRDDSRTRDGFRTRDGPGTPERPATAVVDGDEAVRTSD